MEGIEKAVPSVELSEKLLTYIEDALAQKVDTQTKNELQEYAEGKVGSSVPFYIVRRVFQTLKDAGQDVYLHEMISGSDLVLPGVTFPPRNPELEARIQKLKCEVEEKEYRRMTENVDSSRRGDMEFNFGEELKTMNRQIIAVFNFIVTVLGAFAFGYKAVEVATGTKVFPAQLVSGLFLATIVFFADLYFLLKYKT